MAYGSQAYSKYYLTQAIVFIGLGAAVLGVYASFGDQCHPVCGVVSQYDLRNPVLDIDTTGYDQEYLLPLFKVFDSNEEESAGSSDDIPGKVGYYTHMFACNLSQHFGNNEWWNSSTSNYVSVGTQWNAAKSIAEGSGTNGDWWGNGSSGNFLWETEAGLCYICCEGAYMASDSQCKPDPVSGSPFVRCAEETDCQSGFMPASFPVPPAIALRAQASDIVMYLAVSYILMGCFALLTSCGFFWFANAYDSDFKLDNLTVQGKCAGGMSKTCPYCLTVTNTLVGVFSVLAFIIFWSSKTCYEAHDQFGNKGFFVAVSTTVTIALVVFVLSCIGGSVARYALITDAAFYRPRENPLPERFGFTYYELCCGRAYCRCPCKGDCCACSEENCRCGGCSCYPALERAVKSLCHCYCSLGP